VLEGSREVPSAAVWQADDRAFAPIQRLQRGDLGIIVRKLSVLKRYYKVKCLFPIFSYLDAKIALTNANNMLKFSQEPACR
jgi:hypothetical protein